MGLEGCLEKSFRRKKAGKSKEVAGSGQRMADGA
jgi:hypothetical protein